MPAQAKQYYDITVGFFLKYYHIFATYIMNLNQIEITILIIILGLLILYLVYKHIGLKAVLAVSIIYAIAYILYTSNLSKFYKNNNAYEKTHEKALLEVEKMMK